MAGAFLCLGAVVLTAAESTAHGPGTHAPKANAHKHQGSEPHGAETRGAEMHGVEIHGVEMHGVEAHGAEMLGSDMHGPSNDSLEPAQSYENELERVDEEIAFLTRISEEKPGTWKPLEGLAGLYQERARLTGSLDDLMRADQLVDEAFALAAPGAGPFLQRAALDFSLHRFDRVEDSLAKAEQKVILSPSERAAIRGLRADLMLQFGEPEASLRHLGRTPPVDRDVSWLTIAAEAEGDFVELSRLATFAWSVGQLEAAERFLVKAADGYHGPRAWPQAWIHLHRGLLDLDRGRWDEALSHYEDASAELSGWWLVDEHVAEIYRLQGRTAEAKAIYLDVVERTGHPEFLDALAELAADEGRTADFEMWASRADRLYENQLVSTPEAAWGHAFDHYFEVRRDHERALQLAKMDYRLRPNAETRERLTRARTAVSS